MSRRVVRVSLPVLFVAAVLATACSKSGGGEHPKAEPPKAEHPKAEHPEAAATSAAVPGATADAAASGPAQGIAVLQAVGDSGVAGTVTFTREESGDVRVEAHVTGLTPGLHGFHVHEWGDCSAPDATSAGGHYNPGGHDHAGPDAPTAHAGDLGNLEAGPDGSAHLVVVTSRLSVGPGSADVLGRGLIIHAGADDLASQPTGNAGGRVACGVVMAEAGGTTPVLKPAE